MDTPQLRPADLDDAFDALEAPGTDAVSDWFPWALVGADAISALGGAAGLELESLVEDEGRWFARLAVARAA